MLKQPSASVVVLSRIRAGVDLPFCHDSTLMPAAGAPLTASVTIPVIALGGRGVISTVGNEIPGEMSRLAQACLRGDYETARAIQKRYLPLMNVNFVESNPIPVKAAMGLMGLLEPVYRLPLVPPSAASLAKIGRVLESTGLLEKAPIAN